MKPIEPPPSLTERVYQLIVDDICSGRMTPGTHLVQEQLATTLGVSRQPIQQALALLKADGLIEEVGKRGMQVAALDTTAMWHHYDIRAALDALAAGSSARRAAGNPRIAADIDKRARKILAAGQKAIIKGSIVEQVRQDELFHGLFYEFSGNPFLVRTVEPHWRFLRRVMGEVLRYAEPPRDIWQQHVNILEAVIGGDEKSAARLASEHIRLAAETLQHAMDKRRPAVALAVGG